MSRENENMDPEIEKALRETARKLADGWYLEYGSPQTTKGNLQAVEVHYTDGTGRSGNFRMLQRKAPFHRRILRHVARIFGKLFRSVNGRALRKKDV